MNIKNLLITLLATSTLQACYPVETKYNYNHSLSAATSESKPIYLTIKDTKNTPFYFIIKKYSRDNNYKLLVRWRSPNKNIKLFQGTNSTLKFMINHLEIISLKPIKQPKLSSYSLESRSYEEEAIFSLNEDQFMTITHAEAVTVELTGKHKIVTATFNKRNSFRGFKEFAKNSH